ncbi:MFS transporter [Providencia huaxiensis]|nr:MFS transporter [Providencia sp. PROV032]
MKWKYRFGAVAGNTLEYYDIAVFAAISSYLSAELERLGYNQATEMVWGIFALRFIIRPVGGYIIGRYAEEVGKKPALVLTSLITGIATLCMAMLPIQLLGSYTPIIILILQMALSFSFAGEYPSLVTYLISSAKRAEYGRVSSIICGSSVLGVIISLSVVFVLERILEPKVMQDIGWRIPLLLGVLNIVVSFWFRVRLPSHPSKEKNNFSIKWKNLVPIFLVTIPGTVIFFAQNISTPLFLEELKLVEFKTLYGIISSTLLFVSMIAVGWLTDKYSKPEKVFKLGILGMFIFSFPTYWLMGTQSIQWVICIQFIITIYAAMILSNFSFMLCLYSEGKTASLALGFNLAATILGGITPLLFSYFTKFNLMYIGIYLTLCGLSGVVVYQMNCFKLKA